MKTLYLVRHAKAVDHHLDIDDYDRTLSERGIQDAHKVARKFHSREDNPELMISSTAARALQTAIIFCKVLNFPFERLMLNEGIYDSSTSALLQIIGSVDDQVQSLMLFGHNPEFAQLGEQLSDGFDEHLPTSGTLKLTFATGHWKHLSESAGSLQEFYTR